MVLGEDIEMAGTSSCRLGCSMGLQSYYCILVSITGYRAIQPLDLNPPISFKIKKRQFPPLS